jgi:hypothetical protein
MSTPTSTRRPFDRKRALIGSLTIVALLVLGALWQREHPFSIETSTDIDADPSEVWAALSDFGAYPEWNSALPSVTGQLAVGSTIALGDDSARVTKLVDGERMSWETTTGVIGIFDGERSFLLEPIAGGGTRFTQSIEFRGITVPFVSGTLRDDYAPGLHEMNAELRERVEGE